MKQITWITLGVIVFLTSVCAKAAGVQPQASLSDSTAATTTSTQTKPIQVTLQPWQQRRMGFIKTTQDASKGDLVARKDFDAILTEFETHAFSRTPLENMELLGVFYVPKDGIEKSMSVVIANAVLGWYDALRFASESGRDEIFHNEGFFKKALILGGPDSTNKAVQFLQNNPDKIAKSLAQGFAFADKFRETSNYDRHWPSVYGLERVICATGGSCKTPPPMPKDQWDKAWEEAKLRVTTYYQVSKPPASTDDHSINAPDSQSRISDVGSVPYLTDAGRAHYREFLAHANPRAFVVCQNGAFSITYGDGTHAAALKNQTTGCQLYALDDEVVWKGK